MVTPKYVVIREYVSVVTTQGVAMRGMRRHITSERSTAMAEKVICTIDEGGFLAEILELDSAPNSETEARFNAVIRRSPTEETTPTPFESRLSLDDLIALHRLTRRVFNEIQFQLGRTCPPEL
jgi:hypothetical protein